MSAAGQVTPLEAAPVAPIAPAPPGADDGRAFDDAPSWPVTRLASWSLTALLLFSVLTPAAAGRADAVEWLVLVVPAVLATIGSRALFEVIGFASVDRRPLRRLQSAVPPALLAATVMAGAAAIVGVGFSPAVSAATVALATVTLVTADIARGFEIRMRLAMRRVYFVGAGEAHRDLARELIRHSDATLVGATVLEPRAGRVDGVALAEVVLASRATVLVLDGAALRNPELVQTATLLNLRGVRIRELISYYEYEFKKVPLGELSPAWFLFDIAPIHRQRLYRALRRAIDVTVACALLLLTLPLVLAAALAVRLTSRGPALYRQRRVGQDGEEFTLLKLRTMTELLDPDAPAAWGDADAHRITPVGRLLRRFRLDELPQMWNVIAGDLALIGPRPEQVPIAAGLARELPHYSSRHCIRPGVTGWAQVNLGYGGSVEGTVAKLQRDLYYIKHHDLRLDAAIMWLTVKAVLAGRG